MLVYSTFYFCYATAVNSLLFHIISITQVILIIFLSFHTPDKKPSEINAHEKIQP